MPKQKHKRRKWVSDGGLGLWAWGLSRRRVEEERWSKLGRRDGGRENQELRKQRESVIGRGKKDYFSWRFNKISFFLL